MRRSLGYFWPMNLAVALGTAVTAAVLTGALLVGDSMRGSLRDLILERLGRIDHVLAAEKFFREDLVNELKQLTIFREHFEEVAPAILVSGGAIKSGTEARASQVNIQGVDDRFVQLFAPLPLENEIDFDAKKTDGMFPPVVVNRSLQKELDAEIGDSILLTMRRPSDIHPEFTLGSRDPSDVALAFRVSIVQVIPDRGLGRFGLRTHQSHPRNAFLPLAALQRALKREGRINSLLVAQSNEARGNAKGILQKCLHEVLKLEDLNLKLKPGLDHFTLESRELIISPMVESAASTVSRQLGLSFQPILTYLANSIQARGKEIPYSTVTALDLAASGKDILELTSGGPASLKENAILLNAWAATDLGAEIGDAIDLSYYVVGPRDELLTDSSRFELAGVVALKGLAIDRELTPDIPGVQDADDMSGWDPPVPIDLDHIRPRDEAYWDKYGAAPKAFVNSGRGRSLWSSRFGRVTSIRISAGADEDLEKTRVRFGKALLEALEPSNLGLEFQPVKQQGLLASAGATDFGTLFLAFSFFLIISAALLVGLLFRLGVEQRSREIGLFLSLGYRLKAVRKRFLVEGAVIAGAGSLLGLVGSVGYAWLLIVGLGTWWAKAVGSPFLSLHIRTLSLIVGFLVSWLIVLGSTWLGVRKLAAVPSPLLLQGVTSDSGTTRSGRWIRYFAFVSLGVAIVLILVTLVTHATSSAGLFFGVGTSLLLSGLAFFSFWVEAAHWTPFSPRDLALTVRIAARNSARNPGRSQLSVALVAVACFVIVTVGANRHEPGEELLRHDSGAGGFSWLARSDIPIHQDLNDPEQRFDLGFPEEDSKKLKEAKIIPFRVLAGEDVSCLNLYQPQKPRILGVTSDQTERGGFRFQQLARTSDNPWNLLEEDLGPGIIPAFGDANSVMWILHLGLGDHFELQNEKGKTVKLRLVGLLATSIFQSELLISEANFLQHFPSQTGYQFFLIESPLRDGTEIATLLERNLARYGLDVTSTIGVLAGYLAVENTYLSTFQTLGGLGLLLGTLGLGVVLARNVLERKAELATLRAFGFQRSKLAWIVVAENGFLLTLGLMLGTLSALIAAAPHLASGSSPFPWLSLTATLVAVFLIGMLAGAAAVWVILRMPLLPALRTE